MKKKIAFLLVMTLFMSAFTPISASADQDGVYFSKVYINPLYAGIIDDEYIRSLIPDKPAAVSDDTLKLNAASPLTTKEEVTSAIREHFVGRDSEFTVTFRINGFDFDPDIDECVNGALAHTGVPDEGDYILWHFAGCGLSGSCSGPVESGTWTVTFSAGYYTDAEEEAEVDKSIAALIDELGLREKNDREIVRTVYDWICDNVEYDNSHPYNYFHMYTAYAALIDNYAVCQGYAQLFYRLMLELGIDCRLIAGIGGGDNHAWNIVRLDGRYYNIDSTWGETSGNREKWYLKGDAAKDFPDHRRFSEEDIASMVKSHMMPKTDLDYTSIRFLWKYPMIDGILYGDVDGDGKACTAKDAMHLARYLAGWDGYELQIPEAADFDNDGINGTLRDSLVLTRYLAGWEEYLTLPYTA